MTSGFLHFLQNRQENAITWCIFAIVTVLLNISCVMWCLRLFRSRDRRIGKHSPGFSVFRTEFLMLSRAVFRSRAPSWRSFLLTTNLSHARQITYEVSGFHVTDGDVSNDWGECNGCFCQGGSGNNWPSIDEFYSAKISACRAMSLPRMRKIICAEKEPGPPPEATPQTGWWTSIPLFTVW